jgi:hypothetical protein
MKWMSLSRLWAAMAMSSLLVDHVLCNYYLNFSFDLADSFAYESFSGYQYGSFTLDSSGNVDFWIVDKDGFDSWKSMKTPPTTKLYAGTYCNNCQQFNTLFIPPSSRKKYYFVVSASFPATSASGTLTASMSGSGKEYMTLTCFSADSLIHLKNGTSIPIKSARIGDEILSSSYSGELVYSPVIALPHPSGNTLRGKMVTLTLQSVGETVTSLTLTKEHLLPICSESDCSLCVDSSALSPLSLLPAAKAQPEMCLRSSSHWAKILTVSAPFTSQGMYSVVTLAPYPVINGIVSSPFGYSHLLPSLYYSVHATFYRLGLMRYPAVQEALSEINEQMTDFLSQKSLQGALLFLSR